MFTKVSPVVDKLRVNWPLEFAVPVNILCTSSEISLKFLGLDFGKGNTSDCCVDSFNTALLDANGDQRTFIHPRCKELIKALRTLTYAPNTGLPNKNLGVDHAFDAFGYLCLQQFNLAKPETLGQTAFRIY